MCPHATGPVTYLVVSTVVIVYLASLHPENGMAAVEQA